MFTRWKTRARQLKIDLHALALAYRDPRTPWIARLWTALVVAYAFSPIDLIPDPIPVLGYLDDLLLVPLGIWIALRLIPAEVLTDCRRLAQEAAAESQSTNWIAAAVVVVIWLACAAFVLRLVQ